MRPGPSAGHGGAAPWRAYAPLARPSPRAGRAAARLAPTSVLRDDTHRHLPRNALPPSLDVRFLEANAQGVGLVDAGPQADAPGHLGGHPLQGLLGADDHGFEGFPRLEVPE